MRLYHKTSPEVAAGILHHGFLDHLDPDSQARGVWFADELFDYPTAARGAVIVITVPARVARRFEVPTGPEQVLINGAWIDAPTRSIRCFHVPAAVANRYRRVVQPEGDWR